MDQRPVCFLQQHRGEQARPVCWCRSLRETLLLVFTQKETNVELTVFLPKLLQEVQKPDWVCSVPPGAAATRSCCRLSSDPDGQTPSLLKWTCMVQVCVEVSVHGCRSCLTFLRTAAEPERSFRPFGFRQSVFCSFELSNTSSILFVNRQLYTHSPAEPPRLWSQSFTGTGGFSPCL